MPHVQVYEHVFAVFLSYEVNKEVPDVFFWGERLFHVCDILLLQWLISRLGSLLPTSLKILFFCFAKFFSLAPRVLDAFHFPFVCIFYHFFWPQFSILQTSLNVTETATGRQMCIEYRTSVPWKC